MGRALTTGAGLSALYLVQCFDNVGLACGSYLQRLPSGTRGGKKAEEVATKRG